MLLSLRLFYAEDEFNDRFVCLQANTAVFEACSKERIQPFDDEEEEEEDIWEEKEISFATQTKSRKRSDPQHLIPAVAVLFKEFI